MILGMMESRFDAFRRPHDPLLARVAVLASAAYRGVPVGIETAQEQEIAAEERRLLVATPQEAFEFLSLRAPELRAVLQTVGTPGWLDAHRTRVSYRSRLLRRMGGRRAPADSSRARGQVGTPPRVR
jgi:hypothetical protein